jgi:hypothetical protein
VTPPIQLGIGLGITGLQLQDYKGNGGEGGIRTPDTVSRIPVFKTGAINRSATSPTYSSFTTVRLFWMSFAIAILFEFNRVQAMASSCTVVFQDHPFQPLTHPSAIGGHKLATDFRPRRKQSKSFHFTPMP